MEEAFLGGHVDCHKGLILLLQLGTVASLACLYQPELAAQLMQLGQIAFT